MSRLHVQPVSEATGPAAQLFTAIARAAGKVPNAYAAIGSNSPAALEAALNLDGVLRKSSLQPRELEAIRIAVSEAVGCDYCLAAHVFFGRKAGLDEQAVAGARHGTPSGQPALDALTGFVRTLVTTRGTVPEEQVRAVQAHYSDQQITDALLAVASLTFTNLFNRVNDTEVDFPAVS
jgi:AhpD family alkylhydroperoxidase